MRGVYNPITDEATVTGNVKVTRGDNQLDGSRAEVDMANRHQPGLRRARHARARAVRAAEKKTSPADKTTDKTTDKTASAAPVSGLAPAESAP